MNDTMKSTVEKAKEVADGTFNFPQIDTDLEVWFTFEGKEYELAELNISFRQGIDHKRQPQTEVRGGRISLLLTQSVPDEIYRWAMTSCLRNGSVEFRSKTASSPLKMEFTNAYCVNFDRVVDSGGGLNTALVISPEEVTINGINFDNRWVR